jgi:CheY-like chemotaxis protein
MGRTREGRERDIALTTIAHLEEALHAALGSLYDPAYQPDPVLCRVLGCDPQGGAEEVQAALVRLIREFEPGPEVPAGARVTRLHRVLWLRYVQQRTQEEAAEELAITPRHLRREQQGAISVLAQRIWRDYAPQAGEGDDLDGAGLAVALDGDDELVEWLSQIKQEVACLRKDAAGFAANIGEALAGVSDITRGLASRHGVTLHVEDTPPDLAALIHPSALHQVLVAGITELVRERSLGAVSLGAAARGDRVEITIAGDAPCSCSSDDHLMRELLAAHGGTLEIRAQDTRVEFCISLPSASTISVLVIDDNHDLVHFYRRYTAGTRYSITHLTEGKRALKTAEAQKPDIIVLDVMLPDVDGWELLTHLHEYPASRAIPVIVCSVVREEELALALGAFSYLPKPVRRQQLLEALGLAASRAASTGSRQSASSSAAC